MRDDHDGDLADAEAYAMQTIKQYFASPTSDLDQQGLAARVDKALILLARANSKRDYRLKEISLAFGIARAIGLRGEVLTPLLQALTPASALDLKNVPHGAREHPSTHADPGRRSQPDNA
jgi:hypothetical protein